MRPLLFLLALPLLAACGDGQPLYDVEPTDPVEEPPDDGGGGGIGGDPDLPPGTPTPELRDGIVRYEALDGQGGGYVRDVSYDAASDTFFVDNLAFDGDNAYARDDLVPTLGAGGPATHAVYEASQVILGIDGTPVEQFDYRAVYGVSDTGLTRYAIVRTGSYAGYGFGGFVYERDGGTDLPTRGQAVYAGDYAGLRTFDGRAGLEYTQGAVTITVDFEDFNDGAAVAGVISDRRAFDETGAPIPLGGDGLVLPNLLFEVGPGTITSAGEIGAGLQSRILDESGQLVVYEDGTYSALFAGPGGSEIVGVFVVESEDPRYEGVTAQETGGFVAAR